jgi:hypothetical protein
MTPITRLITVALYAVCAALLSTVATAEPLERDACKSLEAEKRALLTPEMQAALARGPDWVKNHLDSAGDIEKVRQYLLVEEKLAFRCRTNGVRIPPPRLPPLPDPKPPVPIFTVEGQKVLAGAAAISFLPLRKPSPSASEPVQAAATAPESVGDADDSGDSDEDTTAAVPKSGPSQTVADSDKTAPPEIKATQ